MTWDFAEANAFSDSTGSFSGSLGWIPKVLERLSCGTGSIAFQQDASEIPASSGPRIVATDPPYYDNIGYADLSDFFYVWLRRSLRSVYPLLFGTILVPKATELVATPYRFGGQADQAKSFFESGLLQTFTKLRAAHAFAFPLVVYYAFKQKETPSEDGAGQVSTGWETMLEALIRAGFQITATWPIRTERDQGLKSGTNVLASSIGIACRPRPADPRVTSRSQFVTLLRDELAVAVDRLRQANTPPVDLDQSAIGPGMAVFSRYEKVMEGNGVMTVRAALSLINQALDEILTGSDADYDAYTRWAIAWFEQYGFTEGVYGEADKLSTAKDISVQGLVEAGFLYSKAGKVRILRRDELDTGWDPATDERLTVWEVTHHLIRKLEKDGEQAAAAVMSAVGSKADAAKELCYRLFSVCERKGWAQEALGYNMLISSWPEISRLAAQLPSAVSEGEFDFGE